VDGRDERISGLLGAARGRWLALAGVLAVALALGACGSAKTVAPPSGSGPASGPPSSTASGASTAGTLTASMRTKRYCEVLLVQLVNGKASAEVYNSYPLNDCPAEQWTALDANAIAAREGVPRAVLNGPRYWLMDRVEKAASADRVTKDFGGIAMIREASVTVGSLADGAKPYTPHNVNRSTVFTFDAGRTVYELTGADGSTYVMQTWSQQVDPKLAEGDLAGLATRLHLPAGWSYRSRTLTSPLRVVTTTTDAKVLQDDLMNSYSLETGT